MESLAAKAKGAWRSRTVWFGIAVGVLGYLPTARGDIEAMIDALNLQWVKPFVWPAVGVAIIVLRGLTTQPLSER